MTHSVFTVHMLMVQSFPPAVKMYFPSYEQTISVTLVEGETEERIIKHSDHTHTWEPSYQSWVCCETHGVVWTAIIGEQEKSQLQSVRVNFINTSQ